MRRGRRGEPIFTNSFLSEKAVRLTLGVWFLRPWGSWGSWKSGIEGQRGRWYGRRDVRDLRPALGQTGQVPVILPAQLWTTRHEGAASGQRGRRAARGAGALQPAA